MEHTYTHKEYILLVQFMLANTHRIIANM